MTFRAIQSYLILVMMIFLHLQATAQADQSKVSKAAEAMTTKTNEWLKLSPEKSSQMTSINEQMLTSVLEAYKPVKSNPSATEADKKAAMEKSMTAIKNRDAAIRKLLTKDEMAIYKAHQRESRAMAQTKIMSQQLDLSPEQENKIEAINLEASKKLPENDKEMAEMDRNEKMDRARAMRKVQQEKEKAYADVLTPDQMKKYTETRQEARTQMKNKRKGREESSRS